MIGEMSDSSENSTALANIMKMMCVGCNSENRVAAFSILKIRSEYKER